MYSYICLGRCVDVYQQFLDVVKTLPDAWKEEYGTFPVDLKDNTKLRMDTSTHSKLHTNASNEQSNVNPAFNAMRWHIDSLNSMKPNNYSSSSANSTATLSPGPKTPIKVLMKAEEHRDQWVLDRQGDHSGSSNRRSIINNHTPSGTNSSTNEDESNTTTTKENIFYKSNKNMSNISSGNVNTGSVNDPTLSRIRTSPTDQLVSAVLDGDVAGIRAVVKSHGNNSLKSEFWRNITRSILPLHRAISGLHFHGSETLLVNCLDTLLSLGADISELDHSGNTVIHKAIQVCTSKSIVAVIQLLIKKGCNVNVRNREGSMAIHCECKRVRTASARVINLLVKGGADVNAPNRDALQCTPLSLVLLKGVASIAATNNNEQSNATYPTSESVFGSSIGNDPVVDENPWDRSFHSNPDDMNPDEQAEEEGIAMASTYRSRRSNVMNTDKQRVSGRHVWIQAALVLVQSGANWSHQLRLTPEKSSQLHLLFAAFPPAPADVSAYCSLIQSAFKHGLSPCNMEDINKRNALFILCDRMRNVPIESCPDAAKIMKIVIEACNAQPFNNIGSSDRYGVTIFDLSDGTGLESTCFSVCKPLIVENLNATGHNKSKTSNSDALLNKSHVGFGSSFRRSHV